MSLTKNVIENIATNNCYLYNCHELHQELKQIIEKHNGKKLFIYRIIVELHGRVITHTKDSFVGELWYNTHYTLLNDIF